jgi:hypothetical protein
MRTYRQIQFFWMVLGITTLVSCQIHPFPANPTALSTSLDISEKHLWLATYIPASIKSTINLPETWKIVSNQKDSDLIFSLGNRNISTQWIYALVAPFPTLTDNVSSIELLTFWKTGISASIHISKFILSAETTVLLTSAWGSPAEDLVEIRPASEILEFAWSSFGEWAIIPFEEITPKWKVISIDGESPIRKDFKAGQYILNMNFSLNLSNPEVRDKSLEELISNTSFLFPKTNRDVSKMTTVIITGVTALTRDTARLMEQNGLLYPAVNIRDILRQADILHISNEIAFSPTCPHPISPYPPDLVFCSRPEYIQLLEDIGTDVVDMTGDHFIDVSNEDVLFTLQLYKDQGWSYFAAGENIQEARKPLFITKNNNSIAFIGCNAKPIGYSNASATLAGTWHCDWSYLDEEFPQIVKSGFLPIMTFSHNEYYQYIAIPALIEDFRHAADDGAVIISGSQAHQPQAMEFYKDSFIHYGLGNLFFDQYYETPETRKAFIDRHVFYNGKYISTELITIMFVDNAQSRLMTPEERADLLTTVFLASGWENINP